MRKLSLFLTVFLVANVSRAELWISILSLPPQPGTKAFGIYTHCPDEQGFAKIEAYEFADLVTKNKVGEFSAEVLYSPTKMTLVVEQKRTTVLEVQIDTSRSFAQAPFSYRARIFLSPEIYELTPHQSVLSALMLNPTRPEMSYQPSWQENLVECP